MKTNLFKVKKTLFFLFFLFCCKNDFERINKDPFVILKDNFSSHELFSSAQKFLADFHFNYFVTENLLIWLQYISPSRGKINYQINDMYSIPDTWYMGYNCLLYLKEIIYLNEQDKESQEKVRKYGPNKGQVAIARILLAYLQQIMSDTWGDIAYYSYNKSKNLNPKESNDWRYPKFISQEEIYKDLLIELEQAAMDLETIQEMIFEGADFIYNGYPDKWKKFAYSLILRILYRIAHKEPSLVQHYLKYIKEDNLITDNKDNARLTYGASKKDASKFHNAFNIGKKDMMGVSHLLVDLLKGKEKINDKKNPFSKIVDPRLFYYASPKNTRVSKVDSNLSSYFLERYKVKGNLDLEAYQGLLYGIPNASDLQEHFSTPGYEFIKMDSSVYFLTAAETYFNYFALEKNKAYYSKAIRASFLQNNIPIDGKTENLINQITTINTPEGVGIQKWIAYFMQPHLAWSELRLSLLKDPEGINGPFSILLKKGESIIDHNGLSIGTFNPSIEYPLRLSYPIEEKSININAKSISLKGGDNLEGRIWWMYD